MRLKHLFWMITWLVVIACVGILLGLRSYHVFTQEELIATVRIDAAPPGGSASYYLWLTPVGQGSAQAPARFPMYGEQWSIGGDILKWHPWLNLIGLKTCHKLTRLSSRYAKAEMEHSHPRSVYDLNGGTDWVWRGMYRLGEIIPGVEAVYGNAAYAFAQPGSQWGVYVTLSGYLIKPLKSR